MKRAVFDTNVWISGIVFGGEVRKVLLAAIEGKVIPVVSAELLLEVEKVLKSRKFRFSAEAISAISYEIQTLALMAHPRSRVNVIKKDPTDNRVLECAIAGGAAYIVSGDSDLLELGQYSGIKIITPREFLNSLEQ